MNCFRELALNRRDPVEILNVIGVAALFLIMAAKPGLAGQQASSPTTGTVAITGIQLAYYAGDTVNGEVQVAVSVPAQAARLELEISDSEPCLFAHAECNYVIHRFVEINGTSETIPFTLPMLPVKTYMVRATLRVNSEPDPSRRPNLIVLDSHFSRFGVRTTDLIGVPINILKADVVSLPTDKMEASLTKAAASDEPMAVTLSPDYSVMVSVQSVPILGNGVTIPGLTSYANFVGQVVSANGYPEYGSRAEFLFINGALSAKVTRSGDPSSPDGFHSNILYVDPLVDYAASAGNDKHVVYFHHDIVPTDDTGEAKHIDPPEPTDSTPVAAALAAATPVSAVLASTSATAKVALAAPFAAGTPVNHNFTLPVSAYEHYQSDGWTQGRMRVLTRAMNQYVYEFQGVAPIRGGSSNLDPAYRVSVPSWGIQQWRGIDNSNYGDNCHENLTQFSYDYPDPNLINVLFTSKGADCGGIGYRGSNLPGGVHAIVVDNGAGGGTNTYWSGDPEGYHAMVLMMEIGHNFDYFGVESGSNNWDPHTSEQVSNVWYSFSGYQACTAMKGLYGGCSFPEPEYHYSTQQPLQTLAAGIARRIPEAHSFSGPVIQESPGSVAIHGKVKDIGVGADGSVWAITDDSRIWRKQSKAGAADTNNLWDKCPGFAERITVNPDGLPWLVKSDGSILKKSSADCTKSDYIQMPGSARDIGAGGTSGSEAVFIISNSAFGPNYDIYRWNGTGWTLLQAGNGGHVSGVRIAVDSAGNPVTVQSDQSIYAWDTSVQNFKKLPGGATDIAIGGSPETLALIGNNGTAAYTSWETDSTKLRDTPMWVQQNDPKLSATQGVFGARYGLAVDPQGYIWAGFDDRIDGTTVTLDTYMSKYYTANPGNK